MSVRAALIFFISLLSGAPLFAVTLLSESFNYSDGPLVTVSGGKWTTHSGTTGQVDVVSGRVFLSQSENEDVNTLLATNATDIFYASLKLNFTNLPGNANNYFAHFKDSTSTGFRGRLFAMTNATSTGYRIGVGNASNIATVTNATDLNLNISYTIVIRYNATNGTTTLWLNPSAETDPSLTATDNPGTIPVKAFAFRQTTGIGNLFVDDLLVGSSFGDVMGNPTSPVITTQPQDQAVSEGTVVTFNVVASGSGTLSYQWRFNGTNLSGATQATLNLSGVTTNDAGQYLVVVSNVAGSTNSLPATLTVTPISAGALSVFDYNTHGNSVQDWSTNSAQVQAIGRQVAYLKPDVVTFQEIPYTNTYQMTNFVKAFLPGYNLATNSGTDGFIRSVIASRFPIVRSKSWLAGSNLDSFGYTNSNFTRDLFEAQISVPNFEQPVHIFTAHLKSGASSSDDSAKRAAEASAVSNYFVNGFLTTNKSHLFVLTGDMNEDIARPSTGSQQPIQRLANTNTDLHLTTPVNPSTGDERTFSVQSLPLSKRYDYIFPCSLLFSNINHMQVFRTDLLSPTPTNVLSNDDITASDHLPVLMVFNNPYNTPFQIRSFALNNQQVTVNWQSGSNRQYHVEGSSNLTNWTALSGNILASGTNSVFTTNVSGALKFFRVYRTP